MMKSNIIVVGIGYSSFRDIKIKLEDDEYRGRRQEKDQTDLYLDVLYAHKLDLQDINYYQSSPPDVQQLNLGATPLNKIGVRLGYQVISMYRSFFGTKAE